MIEGQIRIQSSTVKTSQTNGDPSVTATLRLVGFKDDAQAHKCLHRLAEALIEFDGQKKLDDER